MLKFILLLLIIILCIVININSKERFTDDDSQQNIYKSKLKYLDTEELNDLCNETKDNDNNIS